MRLHAFEPPRYVAALDERLKRLVRTVATQAGLIVNRHTQPSSTTGTGRTAADEDQWSRWCAYSIARSLRSFDMPTSW